MVLANSHLLPPGKVVTLVVSYSIFANNQPTTDVENVFAGTNFAVRNAVIGLTTPFRVSGFLRPAIVGGNTTKANGQNLSVAELKAFAEQRLGLVGGLVNESVIAVDDGDTTAQSETFSDTTKLIFAGLLIILLLFGVGYAVRAFK